MSGFKDHFSGHAGDYARFRPDYPPTLFDWLAGIAPSCDLAWDAGTGNGQAAHGLVRQFKRVHASDASTEQLAQAVAHERIHFVVEPAEHCSLPDTSADLVTVGQALHWFDWDRFFPEVHRVLRPGGLFAAWTYGLNRVTPAVDAVVRRLYDDILGPWWPAERKFVDNGYRDLPFPFREIPDPRLVMQTHAALKQYRDYLGTWSALRRFQADQGTDPRGLIDQDLVAAWGAPEKVREVTWPLTVRVGFSPG